MKKSFFPVRFRVPVACARFVFVSILAVGMMNSCDEPDEIGLSLIDSRASYGSTDTLTIQAFSGPAEQVVTNQSFINVLGIINDPEFGKIRSGIYSEFRLPTNNFSFGENPVLDSVVFFFGYSGDYYGKVEDFMRVKVYELSENIPEDTLLYSNLHLAHFPDPIGDRLLRPAPTDSVAIDTLMYPPHFSIRLSNEFGQKLIDANGTAAFADVPSFLNYFKGLRIVPDEDIPGTGSVFGINMFSSYTRLSIFYRLGDQESSLRHDFRIDEFTQRFSSFENLGMEHANPILNQQLTGPEPEDLGDSLVFVRAMGQVRGNISLPHLDKLKGLEDIAINYARLVLPVAPGFVNDDFPAAKRLILYKLNQEGRPSSLSDQFFGEESFGGELSSDGTQYHFNITSHIQRLIDEKETDYGMVLFVSGGAENAERIVLNGPGASVNPMRLEIVYSVF